MSTDVKARAGRRLWIGLSGPELTDDERTLLRDIQPGGVILFRRNISSLEQVQAYLADIRSVLGREPIVSIDQEGGLVVRFWKELTVFPGNMALGAASFRETSMGEALAREQGRHSGAELRALGIHLNLAPVLDLAVTGENPGIGIRSFGAPVELATKLGQAMVEGHREAGVQCCLKHFPGKGNAHVDAHLDLPRIVAEGAERDLAPFAELVANGASAVMTSHVVHEGYDAELPVTISPTVVPEVLRGRLGFEGLVVTDDLEMGAMTKHFGFDETVRGVVRSGHDALFICHDPAKQRRAHDLLAAALEEGADWLGDPAASEARLEAFVLPECSVKSDPETAASLAEAIAGRAITVVAEPDPLPKISQGEAVGLLLPALRGETQVENPMRGEEDGESLVRALAERTDLRVARVPTEPDAAAVARALKELEGVTHLLVATTNARFVLAQRDMLLAALEAHPGAVILPLRNPFDLELVPADRPLRAVVPFGFRPSQLLALAKVLAGEVAAYGRLPLDLKRR